jgi:hypothetical protein
MPASDARYAGRAFQRVAGDRLAPAGRIVPAAPFPAAATVAATAATVGASA